MRTIFVDYEYVNTSDGSVFLPHEKEVLERNGMFFEFDVGDIYCEFGEGEEVIPEEVRQKIRSELTALGCMVDMG
jgi:hypothetical protein